MKAKVRKRLVTNHRLVIEETPKDMLPTAYAVQSQANTNEMMRKIEAVSEEISALRLEGQADRIAKANSIWLSCNKQR